MINFKTENPLLLEEREKAKKYLLDEVLVESPLNAELIDDLINLSEVHFMQGETNTAMEINEKNIAIVYSKIYSLELRDILPEHMVKQVTNLKIVK